MKNGSSKLVSIIIRTHNRPEFLSRAVESVYSQDYSPIEIIIVNDAGNNVLHIIEHFRNLPKSQVERIINYTVNQTRVFRASSANIGLELAQGDYIGFLDDDDYFIKNHVSEHVRMLGKDNFFSISKAVESLEHNPNNESFREKEKLYFFPSKINKLNFFFFANYFPNNTIMFNKKVLDKIGKFDPNLFVLEDWDFFIRLFLNYKPAFIEKTTCVFTTRGSLHNIRLSEKYKSNWRESFKYIKNKYRQTFSSSEVTVPISEVSEFLTDYAIEWYDFYKEYELLRKSYLYKFFRISRKFIRGLLFLKRINSETT